MGPERRCRKSSGLRAVRGVLAAAALLFCQLALTQTSFGSTAVMAGSSVRQESEAPAQDDRNRQEPESASGTLYESVGVVDQQEPTEQPDGSEYVIRAGDELSVKFFYSPELNEELTVRPDGRISLQLIPEVVAAGRTPRELTALLQEMYAADLSRPEITVIVRSFTAHRVFVDGEVKKPAEIELSGELTALQSIALAGGFTEAARQNEVILIRRGDDGRPVIIPLNLRDIRRGRPTGRDLALAPYDVVYVPRSRIANVNKWIDQYIRQNIPVSFGFRIDIVD